MAGWQSSPFAGAAIDFSQIGDLYTTYANSQAQAMQREKMRQDMAYQQSQRGKAAADDATLKATLADESIYDGEGNFNAQAAVSRLLKAGDVKNAQTVMGLAADQQKLANGDSTDAIRNYRFYAQQEQSQGRQPMGFNDWRAKATEYGKAGTIVQGPDNQFYSVQYGNNGPPMVTPLQLPSSGQGQGASSVPLSPARGVEVVGDTAIDKATGQTVRNVGDAVAGGEAAKVRGRTQAEGEASLPKAGIALQQDEVQSRVILQDISRAASKANAWTTGLVGSQLSKIAGTDAYDLNQLLTGIQANLGFDRLQQMRENSPTGGALGNVSERETALLQATWGSLVQSQSKEQFLQNLSRLRQIKAQFVQLKRQAYEADVKRFGAGAVPNPDTGQMVTPGSQSSAPVRVRTKAEARNLPSGSKFIDPNGVLREVP